MHPEERKGRTKEVFEETSGGDIVLSLMVAPRRIAEESEDNTLEED